MSDVVITEGHCVPTGAGAPQVGNRTMSTTPPGGSAPVPAVVDRCAPNGLPTPPPCDPAPLLTSPRIAGPKGLLELPGLAAQGLTGQVGDVLASIADELISDTIAHDRRDRVRSYELLAEGWADR